MEDADEDGQAFNLLVTSAPDGLGGNLRYEFDRLRALLSPSEATEDDLEASLEFIEKDSVIIK
eukprot:6187672-Pyramimonas_sp.AAC.1